jgi:hypothetical protein
LLIFRCAALASIIEKSELMPNREKVSPLSQTIAEPFAETKKL